MASISLLASFLLSLTFLSSLISCASPFSLEIHNRFSDKVRHWAESRGHPGVWWPQHGTSEYYAALVHHDRALHNRRSLATTSLEELAFSDGNATYRLSSLGYLYYASVKLGTPNVTFFVALDTGSDLFWVPCDCKQCAALTSPSYAVNFAFNTYNPRSSSTSETISCGSSSCDEVQSSTCSGSNGNCTYSVSYVSANTSTSGYIVEDVIYLTTETNQPQTIQASILFGCAQTQTGTFLNGGAPDGLMGLSMSNVSVPSMLANKGYTFNSFSMCFAEDGLGRINFGDVGSSDQSETPLNVNTQSDLYNISLTGFSVGNTSYTSSFSALVDSGTSFTYFADPMYTDIVTSFNSQVKETRSTDLSAEESFEYCYYSSGQTSASVPDITFTTQGGSSFPVNVAVITIVATTGDTVGYCLAIVKSSSLNIIGENFMTGLRVVFDRERLVLGWKNFDCYNWSAPGPALAPYGYNPEETNKVSVLENGSPHLSTMSSLILLLGVTMLFM